jgi:hypothetical protein
MVAKYTLKERRKLFVARENAWVQKIIRKYEDEETQRGRGRMILAAVKVLRYFRLIKEEEHVRRGDL